MKIPSDAFISNLESLFNPKFKEIEISIKKLKEIMFGQITDIINRLETLENIHNIDSNLIKVNIQNKLEKEDKLKIEKIQNEQKKDNNKKISNELKIEKKNIQKEQIKEIILKKEITQNKYQKENSLINEKIQNNTKKENKLIIEKKYNIDFNNNKNKNLIDFIKLYEKEKLGFNFYEPDEIKQENQLIVEKIKNTIYESFLPEVENCQYEMAGNFLYSIGGISRESLCISNHVFSELFIEYKKYLKNNNEWLTFNHEEDRRNLSIWVKKCLDENQFYDYYSKLNENKINKYLNSNEENNKILLELFSDLIKLYTKCLLSYPLVEVNFAKSYSKFQNSTMFDIIIKGKKKIVNFCYLPALKSNGKLLKEGYFYVFTFIKDKTYQKKENLFNDEIAAQTKLYEIPKLSDIKIDIEKIGKLKIKVLTSPKIPSEFRPNYKFLVGNKKLKIYENNTGIFEISEKYLNEKFYINIEDYMKNSKVSKEFKI